MKFFDCNMFIGRPAVREVWEPVDTAGLLAEMDFCGVERGLVWHAAQFSAGYQPGNRLLAEAIAAEPRLDGCWVITPNQTREFPPAGEFFAAMQAARIKAVRVFPIEHHFLLNGTAMGDWLEALTLARIPLLLSVAQGASWEIVYQVMAEFPELTCVLLDHGCWGEDRRFRPLVECYPRFYIDTSQYLLDGGIEAFVGAYGAGRMLFGSGFPRSYLGGMMMALAHARISPAEREAIAGANLENLLAEVRL